MASTPGTWENSRHAPFGAPTLGVALPKHLTQRLTQALPCDAYPCLLLVPCPSLVPPLCLSSYTHPPPPTPLQFYIRQRDYSKTVNVAPFVINYSGALFREYPGPRQVMLRQDGGVYACVAESDKR